MAIGLGAFAEGFAQGYGQMSEIEARRQAVEREKERMALERDRLDIAKQEAVRAGEMHELNKTKIGMDIAAAKREEDFQKDLRDTLARVQKESGPGYEGEVLDARTNKSQGYRRFQNPEEEIGGMKERGFMFKPGSIKQVGAMDPIDYQLKFADEFMGVQARHGKLTPELLNAARAQRKQIESEGAIDAARYFMSTGDEAGAKAMFAKRGKIKIGDDVSLQVVRDPITGPKIIGTRGGKQVFDMFDDIILPSMSTEAYNKVMADLKKTGIEQTEANKRTAMTVRGGIEEALIRSRGGDGTGGDKMIDRATKEINDQFSMIESGLKLSTNIAGSKDYINKKLQAVSLARDYLGSGQAKTIAQAAYMGWRDAGLPAAAPPR